jgi:hypothetical protein
MKSHMKTRDSAQDRIAYALRDEIVAHNMTKANLALCLRALQWYADQLHPMHPSLRERALEVLREVRERV